MKTNNARLDFLDALDCKRLSGPTPWWEVEFHRWNAFSEQPLILGETFAALDAAGRETAIRQNAETFQQVLEKIPFSAITTPGGFWHSGPGQLAYFILPDDTRFRQLQAVKQLVGDRVALVAAEGGVIMGAHYDPDFCESLFEEPEKIDQEVEARLVRGIENAKRWRDMGADAIYASSDIADNHGPFFNPEQMDRWILPAAERFAAAIKEMAMKPMLHSDGNLTSYVERLARTGLCGLQAIDTVAGMDLSDSLDKARGKMALIGNLDCGLLVAGTPEDVERTAFEMLQAHGTEPGWIFGATNAVQVEVPAENYRAVIRAMNRYRKSTESM